jgi:hypothetical protein
VTRGRGKIAIICKRQHFQENPTGRVKAEGESWIVILKGDLEAEFVPYEFPCKWLYHFNKTIRGVRPIGKVGGTRASRDRSPKFEPGLELA